MQDTALGVWQNISGSGMLTGLYVCALLFLFFWERETYKRILLVYLPAFWIGILLLPITYKVVAEVIDEELYYRFFWMLPMTLVIAYALVQVYHLYGGRYQKVAALGCLAVIVLCGDFVYNNWRYTRARNIYHVPQEVVDICDTMHTQGREVMALFPMELMQYVRQYDSTICMPYGRNVLVADWNINHPLYDVFEAENIDGKALGQTAASYACSFVVVEEGLVYEEDLQESGYARRETLHGYEVYYNSEIFESIYK